MYMAPTSRGQQVGRRLINALLTHASLHFEMRAPVYRYLRGGALFIYAAASLEQKTLMRPQMGW